MTMEVKTIREGGNNGRQIRLAGPVGYGTLTLKRGMTDELRPLGLVRRGRSRDPRLRADGEVVVLARRRRAPSARASSCSAACR